MKYIQPYDQPSNPAAAYVDLNAATGTDGSVPPAAFFNHTQAEILNVIIGAGFTPSSGDLTQLRQAILAMIPTPTGAPSDASLVHWGVDGSASANTVSFTPTPAIASVASGLTVFFKCANDATGSTNLSITTSSGSAIVKPLLRSNGSPIIAGDLLAGRSYVATYDANSGVSGAWRLMRDDRATGLVGFRVFTTSTTYSPADNVRNILAFATGGGGAGGNGGSGSYGGVGGGGGAGATSIWFGIASVQPVVIGAGGAPAATFGDLVVSGDGGTTSFGSLAVANGGKGGRESWIGTGSNGAGGAGGTGSTGSLVIPGTAGANGTSLDGGPGGGSFWGGGGTGGNNPSSASGSAAGTAGALGGGGGGADGAGNAQGGAGGNGVVVILEFA